MFKKGTIIGIIAVASLGVLLFSIHTSRATFGDVTTFIGELYSGDGEQAVDAYFDFPEGITTDGSGNFYLADTYNNVIRKIATNGIVSTFAGTGSTGLTNGSTSVAEFNLPREVAFDDAGNMFVADSGNNVIRKISRGAVTTLVSTDLSNPQGLVAY
ncbi:hypothetical protein ACFL0L_05520, partial [Patescibacteria group bacterium]